MISRAKAVEGRFTPRTTVHRTRSRFLDVGMRLIRDKPLGLLGACIVFTLLGTAVLADVIARMAMRRHACCTVSVPRVSNTGWGQTS